MPTLQSRTFTFVALLHFCKTERQAFAKRSDHFLEMISACSTFSKIKIKLTHYSLVINPSFFPSKWNICPNIQFLVKKWWWKMSKLENLFWNPSMWKDISLRNKFGYFVPFYEVRKTVSPWEYFFIDHFSPSF